MNDNLKTADMFDMLFLIYQSRSRMSKTRSDFQHFNVVFGASLCYSLQHYFRREFITYLSCVAARSIDFRSLF